MVESKPSAHLREMNQRFQLTGTRGKPPSPRSKEAINLEINQAQIPNPRLTSSASAVTWKATLLTLVQEHPTKFPKQ